MRPPRPASVSPRAETSAPAGRAKHVPVNPASPSFAARLSRWQKTHGRHDLPWQNTRDAYRIWLSEIMLQQTQVATVIPYYTRFLAAFPDVAALAAASEDRVLEHWSGLGYYRRAHHLQAAAKAILARHGGEFPRSVDAISALPGIGRSTAAAIAVFAFGARAAILDGNVKRVLARHRGVEGFPGAPAVERKLWRVAETLLPSRDVSAYTQGLMDLGATVCTRAAPRCNACPVARNCVARRDDLVGVLPSPRPAKALPHRSVRVLVLERAGMILLEKRPAAGIWGGLWSFPEMGVDADVATHCRAQFSAGVAEGESLAPIEHGFTHYRLTIHPQRVAVRTWPPRAESPGRLWLTRDDALNAALPAPIRKLVRSL
jgi:A/G-specific adenine glycosylase